MYVISSIFRISFFRGSCSSWRWTFGQIKTFPRATHIGFSGGKERKQQFIHESFLQCRWNGLYAQVQEWMNEWLLHCRFAWMNDWRDLVALSASGSYFHRQWETQSDYANSSLNEEQHSFLQPNTCTHSAACPVPSRGTDSYNFLAFEFDDVLPSARNSSITNQWPQMHHIRWYMKSRDKLIKIRVPNIPLASSSFLLSQE